MYLATSLNGCIAQEDDGVDWMQEAQWASYDEQVSKSGHIVLGRRTFDMLSSDELNDECKYYVVTKNPSPLKRENIEFVSPDKQKIISALEKNSAESVLLIGGSKTNTLMLNSGLVDEVMIDIEPLILGSGINLVDSLNSDIKLELLESKVIGNSLLQLIYKVIK